MEFFAWFKRRGSARQQAKWLYRRGMVRAKLNLHLQAMADYTAVVELDGAPPDLAAMALYNRALLHHTLGNANDAAEDLNTVLRMPAAAARVKTEARRKLLRIQRATDRTGSEA